MTKPFKLKLASPCTVSWDSMTGDERVRHCALCKKNVYDLSTLTRDEAVGLIKGREGNICVSFYQRKDGTVLTADCPVGLARARRLAAAAISLVIAVLLAPVLLARQAAKPGEPLTVDGVIASVRRFAGIKSVDSVAPVDPFIGKVSPPLPPKIVRMSGGLGHDNSDSY